MPVYERGYRHFEGERSLRLLRFVPIAANGVRLAMRSKLFLFLVAFPSHISLIVGAVIAYLFFQQLPLMMQQRGMSPAEMTQASFLFSSAQTQVGPLLYWTIQSVQAGLWIPVIGGLLAGRLIAADAQANALEVYFARPITRLDYALGKFFTAFGFLLYVTLVPPVGAWGVACLFAPNASYFHASKSMAFGLVVNALLISGVSATLMLGVSSASKKPRFASALFVGLMIFSHVASQILLEAIGKPDVYLVSITNNFLIVGYRLVSETVVGQIIQEGVDLPPREHALFVLGGIVLVSIVLFARRLRAVEVVR